MARCKKHVPLLLGLFGFLLYANNLGNEFVNYDDWWVVNNPDFLNWFSPSGLWNLFFNLSKDVRLEHCAEYLPVRDLSAALQYQLFGENPFPYHLVQNALFGLSVFLLFHLALAIGAVWEIALVTSILFLVHPIHVETVTWLTGHKDILCLFFGISALLAFAKERIRLALFLFVLALGSKYIALVLVPIFPLIDRIRSRPLDPVKASSRYLPFFAFAVLTYVIAKYVGSVVGYQPLPLGSDLFGIVRNVLALFDTAVVHLLAPLHLQVYYPYEPVVSWADGRVWRGLLELLLLIRLLVWGWNDRSPLLPGCALFFLTLLPTIRTTEIHLVADRYLLLPSLGLSFVLAVGVRWIRFVWLRAVLIGTVVCVFSFLTFQQNRVWRSSIALWEQAANGQAPVHRKVYENLAVVHRDAGNWKKSAGVYSYLLQTGDREDKGRLDQIINYSHVRIQLGELEEAEKVLELGKALDLTSAKLFLNLGVAQAGQQKYKKAEKNFLKAQELDPENIEVYFNLGRLALDQGNKVALRLYTKELEKRVPTDPRLHLLKQF